MLASSERERTRADAPAGLPETIHIMTGYDDSTHLGSYSITGAPPRAAAGQLPYEGAR